MFGDDLVGLAAYYRDRAEATARLLGSLTATERTDAAQVGRLERDHALWTQLADELDAHRAMEQGDVDSGLF